MTQALTTTNTAADIIESVVIGGDLSKLDPGQRVSYYKAVCESIGLNPLTKPFEYITLNGKLTLYARKDATDQLRKINGVSIEKPDIRFEDDWIIVTISAHDMTGRTDSDIGVVSKRDMRGDFGNAVMKAVTKAKRRVTLSICGLGMLDETEIETIPDAKPARVIVETGEIVPPTNGKPAPKPAQDVTDAEFESLPSASAERAAGNGKSTAPKSKYTTNKPWQNWDGKSDAIEWAESLGCDHFHATGIWTKVQSEGKINSKDMPEPFYNAVVERIAAGKIIPKTKATEPTQAELDAQAAAEEQA